MVAGNGEIIAGGVQDPYHGSSIREFSQGFTLDGIPGIEEQCLGFPGLLLFFESCHPGEGQVLIHAAMDVVRMEQHHPGPGLEGQPQGQQHGRSRNAQEFLTVDHIHPPPGIFFDYTNILFF